MEKKFIMHINGRPNTIHYTKDSKLVEECDCILNIIDTTTPSRQFNVLAKYRDTTLLYVQNRRPILCVHLLCGL